MNGAREAKDVSSWPGRIRRCDFFSVVRRVKEGGVCLSVARIALIRKEEGQSVEPKVNSDGLRERSGGGLVAKEGQRGTKKQKGEERGKERQKEKRGQESGPLPGRSPPQLPSIPQLTPHSCWWL